MRSRRTARARALFAGGAVLVGLALAVPASSGTGDFPPVSMRAVDARDGGLAIDIFSKKDPGATVSLTVNDTEVEAAVTPLADAGTSNAAVIVLDNSNAALNGTVQLAKEAIPLLAPGESPLETVGLVSTANGAKTSVRPTANATAVIQSADALVRGGPSSLWDGIWLGSELLSDTGAAQRNLIVVVGGADGGSTNNFSTTLAQMRTYGITPHVVAVSGSTVNAAELQQWAADAGGTFQTGPDSKITEMLTGVTERIDSQYRLTVAAPPELSGEFASIEGTIAGEEIRASFRPGISSIGPDALAFIDDEKGSGGTFGSTVVLYLIAAFGAFAVGGAVLAIGLLAMKRNDNLEHALRHYDETFGDVVSDDNSDSMANTAFLKRAVEMTGGIAERGGLLVRVEGALERADLPLRAAEALFFYIAACLLSAILAFVTTRNPLLVLMVGVLGGIAPSLIINFLAKRRQKKFNALLPDMLHLLAGTLRAGYSISQGFEAVSTEISEPMGKELRRAVTEARLGRPLEQALESVALRMMSDDFEWAVMAIRIQREVGGNLAELLLTVADTMTERERLRRDVLSLTAEGRMSAIILGFLPPGLGAVMYVMNTEYVSKLFSGTGLFLLGAAAVFMVIGFLWMKKTITIEV